MTAFRGESYKQVVLLLACFFAGGGIQGGRVIGASDRIGGYPAADPHTPEEMAATIYHALGIPKTAAWLDESDRPHHIYHGNPIAELL